MLKVKSLTTVFYNICKNNHTWIFLRLLHIQAFNIYSTVEDKRLNLAVKNTKALRGG